MKSPVARVIISLGEAVVLTKEVSGKASALGLCSVLLSLRSGLVGFLRVLESAELPPCLRVSTPLFSLLGTLRPPSPPVSHFGEFSRPSFLMRVRAAHVVPSDVLSFSTVTICNDRFGYSLPIDIIKYNIIYFLVSAYCLCLKCKFQEDLIHCVPRTLSNAGSPNITRTSC